MSEERDYLVCDELLDLSEPLYADDRINHCPYCGLGGLQWMLMDGLFWRLVDKNRNIHGCAHKINSPP
jgi:hypothetical protein